ncbi:MAG: asparagine synthase (glutamine-hydrolyzing) [Gemmatirosa sp.]
MCGILAVLSRARPIERDYGALLQCIGHRGPDDRAQALFSLQCGGTEPRDRAWLGHTRLSILDLAARGRQPMETPDGALAVVFNGEIYNYVELREECRRAGAEFTTETDTEVLLHAWRLWGESCLTRLKGMFAFVMLDRRAGTATLVRDFFGIKPLYHAMSAGELAVSSELWPLVRSGIAGGELHADVAYEYLRFGATHASDRTLLRDVQSLPPAHLAVFDFRTGTLGPARRYWKLGATRRTISFADAAAECRERFLENVRLHLRSDVPVGAALSGGIDSSSIVCAMRHLEPDLDLKTFSYIPTEASVSEERWVDMVHAQVGGACFKIRPDAHGLAADLETLVRRQGEPFASGSMFAQFRVFQRARAEGVPVTLDGQGADELMAGYWTYVGTFAAERLRRGDVAGAARLAWNAAPGARGRLMMGQLVAQSVLGPAGRAMARRAAGRGLVPAHLDADWLAAQGVDARRTADALVGRHRTLHEHLIATVEHGSLPNLLRYADRNSMAFSVESRVPFLTHDFAEFLLSLPAEYHVSPEGERKHVFREAMRGLLPEPIRRRQDKIGFFADDAQWLRGSREHFAHVWELLPTLPMFDARTLPRFLDDFFAGRNAQAALVWRALVFGLWHLELQRELRSPA